MKKTLKVLFYVFCSLMVIGILAAIFETDEQAAIRELDTKNKEIAAEQVKAEKLQTKADKESEKAKAEAEVKVANDKKNATSKVVLVTTCQLAIKPQLKNPKSMKLDWHQTAMGEMSTGQLGVRMYYYAENSFGATPLSIVNCLFDTDGNLLEYKQVQ